MNRWQTPNKNGGHPASKSLDLSPYLVLCMDETPELFTNTRLGSPEPMFKTTAPSAVSPLPSLLCLLLVLFWQILPSGLDARKKTEPEVSVQKEGENRLVRGEIDIPAPLEIVWAVLTDYDGLETFIPDMEKSRLLKRETDGRILIEQITMGRVLFFTKRVRTVLQMSEHPHHRISFSLIEGDLHTCTGAWDIDARNDSVRLRYTPRHRPAFFAPGFILDRLTKKSTVQILQAVRRESLRRMKENRPTRD